jgi:integrase
MLRARRPEADFLTLDEIERVRAAARALAAAHARGPANALRVDLAIGAGLRLGELHALAADDVRPDGSIVVRMRPGLKCQKPRVSRILFADRGEVVERVRALAREREGRSLWPSEPAAWGHWVVHRLGPASGLQRQTRPLNGGVAPRYRIHPHAFRACFVTIARQAPRRLARAPLSWQSIADLGGWDSADFARRYYYLADWDAICAEIDDAIPAHAPTA